MATKTNQKKLKYISIKAFKERPLSLNDDELAHMCRTQKLSHKFLREYALYLDWTSICYNNQIHLTEELVEDPKVWPFIKWDHLCWRYAHTFSLDFVKRNQKYINWYALLQAKRPLPEEFVIEMIGVMPLDTFFTYQITYYNETFLRQIYRFDPSAFAIGLRTNQVYLSKDFMREIQETIDPNLFAETKQNDWSTMKEFWDQFKGYSWTHIFQNMGEIDIDVALRFKELIHWENNYYVQWMYKFKEYIDNKKSPKTTELKEYFKWLRKRKDELEK